MQEEQEGLIQGGQCRGILYSTRITWIVSCFGGHSGAHFFLSKIDPFSRIDFLRFERWWMRFLPTKGLKVPINRMGIGHPELIFRDLKRSQIKFIMLQDIQVLVLSVCLIVCLSVGETGNGCVRWRWAWVHNKHLSDRIGFFFPRSAHRGNLINLPLPKWKIGRVGSLRNQRAWQYWAEFSLSRPQNRKYGTHHNQFFE